MEKRTFVVTFIAGWLASCSPYVYNQEISNFSTGVTALATTYDSGQQAVISAAVQQDYAKDATTRARLDLLPGCSDVDGSGSPRKFPDCGVVTFGSTTMPPPTQAETLVANAGPTFAALKGYAAALTAITTASDDASLTQATQNLATATTGLTTAVAKIVPGAAAVNTSITAAGGVAGQVISLYLDSRRLAALRANVPMVDDAIATLGNTVRATLLDIRAHQLQQMHSDMDAAVAPFQQPPDTVGKMTAANYQAGLTTIEAKVAAFNQARAADPDSAVTAMVNAHHQLAQALASDAGQSQAVFTAAQNFYNAASQLQSALSAMSKPPASGPATAKPAS